MVIRRFDDINRDILKQKRKEMKDEVSQDIVDIAEKTFNGIEDYFKRKNIEKEVQRKTKPILKSPLWWKILRLLGSLFLLIFILNLILGNVLLLIIIIKTLLGL